MGAGRTYRLIAIPHAKLALAEALPQTNTGKMEMISVMDLVKAIKLAAQGLQLNSRLLSYARDAKSRLISVPHFYCHRQSSVVREKNL